MVDYVAPNAKAIQFDLTRQIVQQPIAFNLGVAKNVVTAVIDAEVLTDVDVTITALYRAKFFPPFLNIATVPFEQALPCESLKNFTWQDALPCSALKKFNFQNAKKTNLTTAILFAQSQALSRNALIEFDQGYNTENKSGIIFEQASALSNNARIGFNQGLLAICNRVADFQQGIISRRNVRVKQQNAKGLTGDFTIGFNSGLNVFGSRPFKFQQALPINYLKTVLDPLPEVEVKEYAAPKSTNIDFNLYCKCTDTAANALKFNLGVAGCVPTTDQQTWYHIMNTLNVERLDNGQKIIAYSGNARTDRQSWTWSYSLSVPFTEIAKLNPINGEPVILKITIAGNEHRMLVERKSRSLRFANDTFEVTGRSPTALLDEPYSMTRSFTQQSDRLVTQLIQAELDYSEKAITLDWQVGDALGYIVKANCLTYANQPPIAAIKMIVEPSGGFIYSTPNGSEIKVLPMYKKTYWEDITISEYDHILPKGLCTSLSTDFVPYPDYNGVTLSNDITGDVGSIKRTGSDGAIQAQPYNNRLLGGQESYLSKGRQLLARSGMIEMHTLNLAVPNDSDLIKPSDIVALSGEWWGTVDSVNIQFNYAKTTQQITVEVGSL